MLKKRKYSTYTSIIFGLCMGLCVHQPCAAIILKSIHGERISWSACKGKWVFINYWASWCESCIEEIKILNQFSQDHRQTAVQVFAVNAEGRSIVQQKKLTKKYKIHYPSLIPSTMRALHLREISVVPMTFVFNPQGQLYTTLYGAQTRKALETILTHPTT